MSKPKKTLIIKAKKIDLSGSDKKSDLEIIASLEALILDNGWDVLVEIFKANISILEQKILEKGSLSEEDCDRLRYKREYLIELINKPQEIIDKLKATKDEIPNYDPYSDVGDKEK
jgi:hypothetical protein